MLRLFSKTEVFIIASSIAILIAIVFLPWEKSLIHSRTGLEFLIAAGPPRSFYTTNLIWVIPIASIGSLIATGWILANPLLRQPAAFIVMCLGCYGMSYYAVLTAYLDERVPIWDVIGSGFWIAFIGLAGLIVQIAIRRK
jgi:hypothetical protein